MPRRPLAPAAPAVLLGAGRQAAHVLSLMEWMGLRWQGLLLFDDAFPEKREGPRGLNVRGKLADGVALCLRRKQPGMVALGSRYGALRYSIFQRLRDGGAALASLVHPSSQVAPSATCGGNLLVMPGCVVGPGVTLGALACLFANVTVEHDTQVGENVVLGPGVTISGWARIGRHAFLGAGSVVAPEVEIGERALIGAGAVVVSAIPPGVVAMGVPARVHRDVRAGDDAPTPEQLRQFGC